MTQALSLVGPFFCLGFFRCVFLVFWEGPVDPAFFFTAFALALAPGFLLARFFAGEGAVLSA